MEILPIVLIMSIILNIVSALFIGISLSKSTKLTHLERAYSQIQEYYSKLEGEKNLSLHKLEDMNKQNLALEENLKHMETIRQENKDLTVKMSVKDEKIQQLEKNIQEQKTYIETISKQMKLEFENISKNLLEEQRSKFKEQSDESLHTITTPLRQNIADFRNRMEELDKKQEVRTTILENSIEKNTITTSHLTNAFTQDKKLQGSWGEHHLTMVLEQSGLTKGREYETQVAVKREGTLIIDALIKLPGKQHLIIDSKVSVNNYANMQNATTPEDRERYKKEFLKNVEDQMINLGSKHYHDALKDNESLRSPEFVFMFMPLESAFAFAINEKTSLYKTGLNKKVVLCSPTTLFGYLMTVASMWSAARQNDNAILIKEVATDLVKRMEGFVKEIDTLENNMGTVQKTLGRIQTKLSGQQGVLRITKKLDKLGIRNKLINKDSDNELLEHNLIQDQALFLESEQEAQNEINNTELLEDNNE